jgi:hypothetical protein
LQDHLRIGAYDIDHPVYCRCKKHRQLQEPKQGLSERSVSPSPHWPSFRPHGWVWAPKFPGCLLGLSSDTPHRGRLARHHVHHSFWLFLLCKNVIRTKEHGVYTYQRCMQFYFKNQIGYNLEVYVDEIMIKSWKSCSLISDLEETFNNLQWFNIKLNSEKCTIGIP